MDLIFLSKPIIISKKTLVLAIVIVLLIAGNILFGIKFFTKWQEAEKLKREAITQQMNAKTINFLKLFIEKVLKAKTEVSFEERLKLENSIRNLNDPKILAQWEKFLESKTQEEAQENVKDLLDLLASRLAY